MVVKNMFIQTKSRRLEPERGSCYDRYVEPDDDEHHDVHGYDDEDDGDTDDGNDSGNDDDNDDDNDNDNDSGNDNDNDDDNGWWQVRLIRAWTSCSA